MRIVNITSCVGITIITSPEPKAHLGELIGYPRSVVFVRRPSTISNVFSSETGWPIKAKFYVEPP